MHMKKDDRINNKQKQENVVLINIHIHISIHVLRKRNPEFCNLVQK